MHLALHRVADRGGGTSFGGEIEFFFFFFFRRHIPAENKGLGAEMVGQGRDSSTTRQTDRSGIRSACFVRLDCLFFFLFSFPFSSHIAGIGLLRIVLGWVYEVYSWGLIVWIGCLLIPESFTQLTTTVQCLRSTYRTQMKRKFKNLRPGVFLLPSMVHLQV